MMCMLLPMLPPQPLPGCTKRLTVAAVILYTAARIVANVVMVETIGHSIWTEMQLRGGFCCSSHFLCVFLVFFVGVQRHGLIGFCFLARCHVLAGDWSPSFSQELRSTASKLTSSSTLTGNWIHPMYSTFFGVNT